MEPSLKAYSDSLMELPLNNNTEMNYKSITIEPIVLL